jgi:hypothetical protein
VRGVVWLTAAGALALAAPAHAGPLFDAFNAACVMTAAKLDGVEAEAKASGWNVMPKVLLDQVAEGFKAATFSPTDFQGWMKTEANGFSMLLWAKAEIPVKGVGNANLCAVASVPPQPDAEVSLRRWAAVPTREDFNMGAGGTAYLFTIEDGGAHRELPARMTDTEVQKVFATGRLQVAVHKSDAQLSMLGLFVPIK